MNKAIKKNAPQNTALTLPDELADELVADAGKGFEEANKDAFAIPFLRILQDLSPQVKSKMSGYIDGAKPSMIFNTVSQELFAGNIKVIPCHFSQCFIEWKPRKGDGQGGFVQRFDATFGARKLAQCTRDGARNVLPNGNDLMDTREHYVLLVRPDGKTEGCLIALQSTGLKISRRWMSQMRAAMLEVKGKLINAPMYAYVYTLGREEEANEQGQWYQWSILDRERVTSKAHYDAAKQFAQSMKTGAGKINYDELRNEPNSSPTDIDNEIDA